MPKKGEKLKYSNRAGACRYPIKPGMLFRLKKLRYRHNPRFHRQIEHIVYIWVQAIAEYEEHISQPKRQRYWTFILYVPKDTLKRLMDSTKGNKNEIEINIRETKFNKIILAKNRIKRLLTGLEKLAINIR